MNNNNRFFSPLSMGEGSGVRLFFALSLSLFSFASCTQESFAPDVPEVDGERHEIVLSANMGDISAEVTPATRVDADPTKAMTMYFVRSEKGSDGSWPGYGTYFSTYGILTATRAAGADEQPVTFNSTQYYPMGKLAGQESANSYNEVSFIGWTGATGTMATAYDGGRIDVNVDGTQDVMVSNEITGSYTNRFTSSGNTLSFKHVFSKIIVKIKAADDAAAGRWGNVTNIQAKSIPTIVYIDGQPYKYRVAGSSTRTLEGFTAKTLTTSYQPVGTIFAYGDNTSTTSMTFSVTTALGGTRNVTVSLGSGCFKAGTAYIVSLDFKSTAIAPSASITAWTTSSVSADL